MQTVWLHVHFGHWLSTNFTTVYIQYQQQYISPVWKKHFPAEMIHVFVWFMFTFQHALFSTKQHSGDTLGPSAWTFSTNIQGFQAFWYVSSTVNREWVGETPSYPLIDHTSWGVGGLCFGKINVRLWCVAGKELMYLLKWARLWICSASHRIIHFGESVLGLLLERYFKFNCNHILLTILTCWA